MKRGQCARCGKRIYVRDDFDRDEEMEVCADCEFDLIHRWDEGAKE